MSLREEVENAVAMDPMHHGEEEEEEVTLTTNVKSHEAERRRGTPETVFTRLEETKKMEAPETVFTRLGDVTKTVLTGSGITTTMAQFGSESNYGIHKGWGTMYILVSGG